MQPAARPAALPAVSAAEDVCVCLPPSSTEDNAKTTNPDSETKDLLGWKAWLNVHHSRDNSGHQVLCIQPSDKFLDHKSFAEFVSAFSDASSWTENPVVQFFRHLDCYVRHALKVDDFHLSVEDYKGDSRSHDSHVVRVGFCVRIYYGKNYQSCLKDRALCISCDLDNDVSKAAFLYSSRFHNLWLDAKARSMFVVTPHRHVERLSQLSDEELFSFWSEACALLASEYDCALPAVQFDRMVVNQGLYRNLSHLHMKVYTGKSRWVALQRTWQVDRWRKWERIIQLSSDREIVRQLIGP